MAAPGFLCSRCGSPVAAVPDGEGACPSCGLGFTSVTLTARRRWFGRRSRDRVAPLPPPAPPLPFVSFGLDERWQGPRSLGGWGGHDGRVDHVELLHGDPFSGGPVVRVQTGGGLRETAQRLAEVVWREAGEHSAPMRSPFAEADPLAGWHEVGIPVGGRRVAFRTLGAGAVWVALAEVEPGLVVGVEARGVDTAEVGLVPVEPA